LLPPTLNESAHAKSQPNREKTDPGAGAPGAAEPLERGLPAAARRLDAARRLGQITEREGAPVVPRPGCGKPGAAAGFFAAEAMRARLALSRARWGRRSGFWDLSRGESHAWVGLELWR